MSNEKKLLAIIIFCFCTFIYSYDKGVSQKEIYVQEADLYLDAKMYLYIEKDTKKATEKIKILQNKYPDNYIFLIDIGNAYMLEKEYEKAQIEYEKALKQRPVLIDIPSFLYNYAKALHENGHYIKSQEIFQKAKSISS